MTGEIGFSGFFELDLVQGRAVGETKGGLCIESPGGGRLGDNGTTARLEKVAVSFASLLDPELSCSWMLETGVACDFSAQAALIATES